MAEVTSARFDAPEGYSAYPEVEFRAYPGGDFRFYGVDSEGKLNQLKNSSSLETALWLAHDPDPYNFDVPKRAIWLDNNGDLPVTVIGLIGKDTHNNHEYLYKVREYAEGIPGSKLKFVKEEADPSITNENKNLREEVDDLRREVAELRQSFVELREENRNLKARNEQLEGVLREHDIPIPDVPSRRQSPQRVALVGGPPVEPAPPPIDGQPGEADAAFLAEFKPGTSLRLRIGNEEQDGWIVRDGIIEYNRESKPFIKVDRKGEERRAYRDEIIGVGGRSNAPTAAAAAADNSPPRPVTRDGRRIRGIPHREPEIVTLEDGRRVEIIQEDDREDRAALALGGLAVGAVVGGALVGTAWLIWGRHHGLSPEELNEFRKNITKNINGHMDGQVDILKDRLARANGRLHDTLQQLRHIRHAVAANHHLLEHLKHEEAKEVISTKLANFHTGSFFGKTPHQAVANMFNVIRDNHIDVHGLTSHKIDQIVNDMKSNGWHIASGMKSANEQNIVNVASDWADGRTQNWSASALQGLKRVNGSSAGEWHRFIQLAASHGVSFTHRG